MIIKVLGTGCPKCKLLNTTIHEVVTESGIDAQIIKVQDMEDIIAYDIMRLPGIVINEQLVMEGKIPNKEELKNLLAKYK